MQELQKKTGAAPKAEMPLISVIVPVHNGQDYLENCIDSILAQTWRHLEILVVNDGSTDRTGEICERLQRLHGNFRLLDLSDAGVSAARNAGLAAAGGELVTFVDADDCLHPNMLEILYQSMRKADADAAGCRFFIWQTQEELRNAAAREWKGGKSRTLSWKQFVLDGILKDDTRCWSKLYKRECLEKVRFREGLTIGEDMLFLVELAPCLNRIVTMDFEGYGYYQNPKGAMNRRFQPSYMDQIICWRLAGEKLSAWITGPEKQTVEEIIAARQMTGILLTVGKLADLNGKARKEQKAYVELCHREMKSCLKAGRGMEMLDRSYRFKARSFAAFPGLYLLLYGTLRQLKPAARRG